MSKSIHASLPETIWPLPSLLDDDERERACRLGSDYASFLMGHREKTPSGAEFSIWQNWQVRTRVYLLAWHRKVIMPRRRNPVIERMIVERLP